MPQIEKLYWGCNYHKCIGKLAELRTWREHIKKKRKLSLPNPFLIKMVKALPKIENVWISELTDQAGMRDLIKEMKEMSNLKHLALGNFNILQEELQLTN